MPPRIVYLFKAGRTSRLAGKEQYPSDFFYGYLEMLESGVPVEILDENDFNLGHVPNLFWKIVSRLSHAISGVHLWAAWRLARRPARERLNKFEAVVATTNTFGMALALIIKLGLLKKPVVFLAMGIVDLADNPVRRTIMRWLLASVRVATISKGECVRFSEAFAPVKAASYVPFGVDARFWTPANGTATDEPYVLSIGNDHHRDYETLVSAWKPDFPQLKIVTSLPIDSSCKNVEVNAGDWRKQIYSDAQVRDLFRKALFVVIPVRETYQPSGQSACLQAMSCGKAVVMSNIQGLWDRDVMIHDETCVLVPCASSSALEATVRELLNNPQHVSHVGVRARRAVEHQLNIKVMAIEMEKLIHSDSRKADHVI